jgi:multidrug efflux pump
MPRNGAAWPIMVINRLRNRMRDQAGLCSRRAAARAGSASQNAIGIGVAGGMVTATVLGVFFVPVLYVLVRRLFPSRKKDEKGQVHEQAVASPAE